MAEILKWGLNNFDPLSDGEILVPPPSGSSDEYNHMVKIGEKLNQKVDLTLVDATYKSEDYPPQKDMSSQEERKQNVRDKIECDKGLNGISTAVVIDDIVTTCTTISDTARVLHESGVDTVYGLGIGRSVSFEGLVHAEAMEVVDDED
jgi:predicted amidophosphoribosyltransferase